MRLFATILILLISNSIFAQKHLYFEKLNDFKNGYALVQIGNKKGFIDTNGNLIGQLDVSLSQGANDATMYQGKSVYICHNSGIFKKGVRKYTGEHILKVNFLIQPINSFYTINDSDKLHKIMDEDGAIIYSTTLNKYITKPIFPISKELIGIKNLKDEKNAKYAVKSLTSNFKSNYIYKRFSKLNNGLIKAIRYSEEAGKDKWGFLNNKGREVIDFIYTSEPSDFSDNKAVVKNTSNLYGYIDTNNKIILEPQFIEAYKFVNDKAIVRIYKYKRINNRPNNGYRLINTKGEILFDFGESKVVKKFYGKGKYSIIENGNIVKIWSGATISLFNTDNLKIIETPYGRIGNFDSNLALVSYKKNKDHKMGYINKKGELVFCTEKKNQF